MKFDALKRSRSRPPIYSARVSDEDRQNHYELSISGPQKLLEKVFAKVDFEIEIAPRVTSDQFQERSRRFWDSRIGKHSAVPPPIQTVAALLGQKHGPPAATKDSVVVVYLRRTEGAGTFWALWVPTLTLPPGISVFFVLPRVWTTWSGVAPFTGNPNLFLTLGGPPPAPLVASATAGGTISEGVSFTTAPFPWSQFSAWHRVVGAVPPVTVTHFALVGHSVTPF